MNKLEPLLGDGSVILDVYTEYKYHGNLYRAHPNYKVGTGEWYDWASVFFEAEDSESEDSESEKDPYPSKLLCFFTIRGDNPDIKFAVVHSCDQPILVGEDHSVLTEKWRREYQNRRDGESNMLFPKCCLVPVESIEKPEFVVENTPGLRQYITKNVDSETIILVKNVEEYWPSAFFQICSPDEE